MTHDTTREGARSARLQLFVLGRSEIMRRAIENARSLGEVDIIDVRQNPDRAEAARILATPTLIVADAGSKARIVGDLSDLDTVRYHLGLSSQEEGPENGDPA